MRLFMPYWMKKYYLSQEQLFEVDALFETLDMKTLKKAALRAKNSRVRFAAVKQLKQQIAQKYPEKTETEHCAMTPGLKELKEDVLFPMLNKRGAYFDDPDRLWAASCFSQLYSSNVFFSELSDSLIDRDVAEILLLNERKYIESVIDSSFDEEFITLISSVDEYNRISGAWYVAIKPYCTKRLSELSGQKPTKE